MNTYQKYIESSEDEEPQYIVDSVGTLHDLSGDLDHKLEKVEHNINYWKSRIEENPTAGSKFFHNFLRLKEQILLFKEGRDIVAHI